MPRAASINSYHPDYFTIIKTSVNTPLRIPFPTESAARQFRFELYAFKKALMTAADKPNGTNYQSTLDDFNCISLRIEPGAPGDSRFFVLASKKEPINLSGIEEAFRNAGLELRGTRTAERFKDLLEPAEPAERPYQGAYAPNTATTDASPKQPQLITPEQQERQDQVLRDLGFLPKTPAK